MDLSSEWFRVTLLCRQEMHKEITVSTSKTVLFYPGQFSKIHIDYFLSTQAMCLSNYLSLLSYLDIVIAYPLK
jgi:hypothetical protein